jgi:hypothetical protein
MARLISGGVAVYDDRAMPHAAPSPADDRYIAHDWAAALALYQRALEADPGQAAATALPLLIAHCRLELADDPARLPEPPPAAASGSAREQALVRMLYGRALELCRAGASVRASVLLRLLAGYDRALADAYRDILTPGRSAASQAPAAAPEPPFLRALGLADLSIDAVRQRHRGTRVLIVQRQFFPDGGNRRLEPIHCLVTTAERFGLTVRTFRPTDPDAAALASALLRDLIAFAPDVVLYDHEYPSVATAPDAVRAQIEAVLTTARTQFGVRVVVAYMDAWQPLARASDALFRGLGSTFDLVQHAHPAALGIGTAAQNAKTYCFGYPTVELAPSVAPDTVPRACFAGSITHFNIARLAWWAETTRRALPVDVFESRHVEHAARSDQDYIDLFARYQIALSFTRRGGGPKILTGRTLDIPLAGGVLVEERSVDTDFFLVPGEHYVPFETLDDLAAIIPALLADPARRARIRDAGRAWARTYFTGDYFWAGMLTRLWA